MRKLTKDQMIKLLAETNLCDFEVFETELEHMVGLAYVFGSQKVFADVAIKFNKDDVRVIFETDINYEAVMSVIIRQPKRIFHLQYKWKSAERLVFSECHYVVLS